MEIIQQILSNHFGHAVEVSQSRHLAGGCINEVLAVETSEGEFCVKLNHADKVSMFEAEARGVQLLHSHTSITTPKVIVSGQLSGKSFLVLNYVPTAPRKSVYWSLLGKGLADLHRVNHPKYGLDFDNYIGVLEQKNDFLSSWSSFFIENRLEVQLSLALRQGKIDHHFQNKCRKIYPVVEKLFPEEPPALLHGDLWGGNVGVDQRGEPFIYDPAVYFGHREIELAFTRLFGGFDPEFYTSYEENFPLSPGFDERIDLYNLYPLIVHANLFGSSYLNSVDQILNRFI